LDDVVALLQELCAGAGAAVVPRIDRPLTADGADPADLLLRFAREVHAMFAIESIVPAHFELGALELPAGGGAASLSGRLRGEPFDPSRHATQPEIKAVTRHGLVVRHDQRGWHAELLLDV
jgi:SHS2 domain-containing protein